MDACVWQAAPQAQPEGVWYAPIGVLYRWDDLDLITYVHLRSLSVTSSSTTAMEISTAPPQATFMCGKKNSNSNYKP